MRRHRQRSRLLIGIVGAIVVAAGVYVVFTKHIPFVHGYRVKAVFNSSNQLITGSPVRVAGVNVGKVTHIEAGPNATTVIEMEINDNGRPLHTDARFRIRPRLFLEGGFAVEMNPGSPTAPQLPAGATVPLSQTATPVQFHQILSAFNRPTREAFVTLVKEADTAFGNGGAEALGKSMKPLAPVLSDTAQIAEAARGVKPHDASDIVVSSSKITGALASRRDDLAGMVTALHRTTAAIASRDTQLADSLRQVDGLLQDAPSALSAIDSAIPPVERITAAIRPGLRAAPPVLDRASRVLDQLGGLVSKDELPKLIKPLGAAVKDLPTLESRLGDLFPLVTPVTDCVRDKALPVLLAKAPDGSLSSNRPIWQDLVHSMVGLADAAQTFDGNGFNVRYLAGFGAQSFSTGTVPNVGTLVGLADQAITGARPLWFGPGVQPGPFRPDQKCTDQPLPDLNARTQQVTPGRMHKVTRKPVTAAQLAKAIARLKRAEARHNR